MRTKKTKRGKREGEKTVEGSSVCCLPWGSQQRTAEKKERNGEGKTEKAKKKNDRKKRRKKKTCKAILGSVIILFSFSQE